MPHVIGSTGAELSYRSRRGGAPFSVRLASKSNAVLMAKDEGPSCLFVGPIETASKETLEALYRQARDSYYSGKPLIVDDMFDRVELKLRSYGSKSVVKYPRCSLRQQTTYADAEVDISQALALASIWVLIFAIGSSVCLVPTIYTINVANQDRFLSEFSSFGHASSLKFISSVKGIIFTGLSALVGFPIASAAVKVLQRLWRKDLVGLKGACPNCGEEVFAFVRSDQPHESPHRADCHVCESTLEFRTKAEQSVSTLGRRWVYGRVYLVSRRRQRSQRQAWI